ncbi:MAG: hypothetical protein AB7V62_10875 [Thermoleophilia bacterium]
MYLEHDLTVPADRAYWTFLETTLPAMNLPVALHLRGLRMPIAYRLVAERLDTNPAHTNHLVLQCQLITSPVSRLKVGGAMHVAFAQVELHPSPESRIAIDLGHEDAYGGELFNAFMGSIPRPLWWWMRKGNTLVRWELRVADERIVWQANWEKKEEAFREIGRRLLGAWSDAAASRLEKDLLVFHR